MSHQPESRKYKINDLYNDADGCFEKNPMEVQNAKPWQGGVAVTTMRNMRLSLITSRYF
jgi:hypothetical protein